MMGIAQFWTYAHQSDFVRMLVIMIDQDSYDGYGLDKGGSNTMIIIPGQLLKGVNKYNEHSAGSTLARRDLLL